MNAMARMQSHSDNIRDNSLTLHDNGVIYVARDQSCSFFDEC